MGMFSVHPPHNITAAVHVFKKEIWDKTKSLFKLALSIGMGCIRLKEILILVGYALMHNRLLSIEYQAVRVFDCKPATSYIVCGYSGCYVK